MSTPHTPHLSNEDLVLHYYAESEGLAEPEAHLGECSECRSRYRTLVQVMNTVDSINIPERPADYEVQVWQRLEPRLGRPRRSWRRWLQPRQWAVAAAVTAMLVVAFFAGRWSNPTAAPGQVAKGGPASQVRERVLVIAVSDHLDRSQMMLLELVNSPDNKKVNIADQQQTAEDLLEANRLYRQTAVKSGDAGVATVLDELERVLLEVAHSPENLDKEQLASLRREIEEQGVLFKVRVLGSRLRQQQDRPRQEGAARL